MRIKCIREKQKGSIAMHAFPRDKLPLRFIVQMSAACPAAAAVALAAAGAVAVAAVAYPRESLEYSYALLLLQLRCCTL